MNKSYKTKSSAVAAIKKAGLQNVAHHIRANGKRFAPEFFVYIREDNHEILQRGFQCVLIRKEPIIEFFEKLKGMTTAGAFAAAFAMPDEVAEMFLANIVDDKDNFNVVRDAHRFANAPTVPSVPAVPDVADSQTAAMETRKEFVDRTNKDPDYQFYIPVPHVFESADVATIYVKKFEPGSVPAILEDMVIVEDGGDAYDGNSLSIYSPEQCDALIHALKIARDITWRE